VNSGLIGISGAVKTIVALLKKPDNRSAAITCLGKTAELCVEQVQVSSHTCMHTLSISCVTTFSRLLRGHCNHDDHVADLS
jgi:hypothetical protein